MHVTRYEAWTLVKDQMAAAMSQLASYGPEGTASVHFTAQGKVKAILREDGSEHAATAGRNSFDKVDLVYIAAIRSGDDAAFFVNALPGYASRVEVLKASLENLALYAQATGAVQKFDAIRIDIDAASEVAPNVTFTFDDVIYTWETPESSLASRTEIESSVP